MNLKKIRQRIELEYSYLDEKRAQEERLSSIIVNLLVSLLYEINHNKFSKKIENKINIIDDYINELAINNFYFYCFDFLKPTTDKQIFIIEKKLNKKLSYSEAFIIYNNLKYILNEILHDMHYKKFTTIRKYKGIK